MTTSWEQRLREDLAALAEPPGRGVPGSPADRALADAKKVRRRRAGLLAAGSVALVALAATPVVVNTVGLPFGAGGSGTPCESATDEADPPRKTPVSKMPRFVRTVVAKLPARDDYYLQSAQGMCAMAGHRPHGYTVINLGPYREHGHLTVRIQFWIGPGNCAGLEEPQQRTLSCEEATDSSPLVLAQSLDGNGFVVTAIHPDSRAVTIGAHGTPFDVATIRSVATDAELIDLLF